MHMSERKKRANVYQNPTTKAETVGYQEKQHNFLTYAKKVQC